MSHLRHFHPVSESTATTPPESIVEAKEALPYVVNPEDVAGAAQIATRQIRASGGNGEGQGWVMEHAHPGSGEPSYEALLADAQRLASNWANAENRLLLMRLDRAVTFRCSYCDKVLPCEEGKGAEAARVHVLNCDLGPYIDLRNERDSARAEVERLRGRLHIMRDAVLGSQNFLSSVLTDDRRRCLLGLMGGHNHQVMRELEQAIGGIDGLLVEALKP